MEVNGKNSNPNSYSNPKPKKGSTESDTSLNDWLPITSSRKAKWWYAAIHNVTSMVGAGILGLPFAMSQLGWYVFFFFSFVNFDFYGFSLKFYNFVFYEFYIILLYKTKPYLIFML